MKNKMNTMRPKTKRIFYVIGTLLFIYVMSRFLFSSSDDDITKPKENDAKVSKKGYHVAPAQLYWEQFANFDLPAFPSTNCQKNEFKGATEVNINPVPLDELWKNELPHVKKGGWWHPKHCDHFNSTAVVIPYHGDRPEHLSILLRHLHPILKKQNLNYRVFVVQQIDKNEFNLGKLKNVGFSQSLKNFPFSCIVFHDVDLIPENDRIHYGCEKSPMHLSSSITKNKHRLPNSVGFSDVQMITPRHFIKANGFSNIFYTRIGGEDAEMSRRLTLQGLFVQRPSNSIGKYKHLARNEPQVSEQLGENDIVDLMKKSSLNWEKDGLSSLQYDVEEIINEDLYTLVKVDLRKENDDKFGLHI